MSHLVYIQTSDGILFHIHENILKHSNIIYDLLKLRSNTNEVIPLFHVTSSDFTLLIQWLIFHTEHPHMYPDYELGKRDTQRHLHPYDIEFCKSLSKHDLFSLLKVSTQLSIDMLVEITSKYIASILNTMSTEEMRVYLEEDDDLSSEELEEIDERFSY